MSKHTPGPWEKDENNYFQANGTYFFKAVHGPFTSDQEEEANCKLIAAAPELLEALKTVLPCYQALLADCGLRHGAAISRARELISRIEGA